MNRPLLTAFVFTLAVFLHGASASASAGGEGLRVTDYFLSHTSNEPFYAQQKLDASVTLHVREVVLVGRERTVSKDGKVLLLIHGATIPGYVAFDTDHENASLMRHFAQAGWDVFALDLEGYGLSTRPLLMDDPGAFPNSKAPMHSDVTVRNVERAVEFILGLRRVEKLHLLGWSSGADLEAPLYTIRHPGKVARLVLFGVGYDDPTSMDERKKQAAADETAMVLYSRPTSVARWAGLGTKEEFVIPGAFEAFRKAFLASDPKSGELGGAVRWPAGRSVDWNLSKPFFDASKIRVPTLVIRGEADTWATHESNQRLMDALSGDVKNYVAIPNAGHYLQFEKTNKQFYRAVEDFLEPKQ
jgi:pimeloyl-ACP methyl ester carboxylesterase